MRMATSLLGHETILGNRVHLLDVYPYTYISSHILTWKMSVLMISLWMAATPLTALPPTVARNAMFTSLRGFRAPAQGSG